ncbi:hypothetical protein YYG_03699 [Plasmodium vinckei petteri]|uniref:Uncharacterized protein n=1 Tax=Plasmodium vinckei petteri TaxID=138298 RepID=W7AIL5_PLAVN|nr:hypothetical protein YYG_03699 [Plasmodium vinckei petteri]CAD2100060.1 conserved Plasmodium protein, unknown function [Plasmodium vinckei petteri]
MQVEKRIDSRNFDFVLPVHVDIDQINEVNKTCKYISGNVNPEIYTKNTNNKITKIIGGDYNYEIVNEHSNENGEEVIKKKVIIGNGSSSIVCTTLIGPTANNLMFSKGIELTQLNIRIKNMQGYRNEREKIFEEIVVKNFEQVIDHGLYKFQQFNIKVQILQETSYILSSIINSITLNFICNNISMNYVINSVNIGIVDKEKYINFLEKKYAVSSLLPEAAIKLQNQVNISKLCSDTNYDNTSTNQEADEKNDKPMYEHERTYHSLKNSLFYEHDNNRYIPKIILDPLDKEIELYCSSAFCFIIAPDFNKILSNILIKSNIGISNDIFKISKSYACKFSHLLHEHVRKSFNEHLARLETTLSSNYFF